MARNLLSVLRPGLGRRGVASVEYAVLMAGLVGLAAATMPAMMRGIGQGFAAIGAQVTTEQARLRGGLGIQAIGGSQGVHDAGDRAALPR